MRPPEVIAAIDRRGRSGNSFVETTLLIPWVVFLFIAVFDFGFYAYALICTQNAARAAALYAHANATTAVDSAGACDYAIRELNSLPNTRSLTACVASPLVVNAQLIDPAVDGARATRVTVTYDTIPMLPIPWMPSNMTISRVVEMRLKK